MFATHLVWLTTFVPVLYITTSSSERIDCESAQTFSVQAEIDKQIYVYDADIAVEYDRNELAVYQYPATNAVNILINNTVVSFAGHVVYNNEVLKTDAFKAWKVLNTKIAGSAQLTNSTYDEKLLSDCSIYLARMPKQSIGLPRKLEIEILHRAASCVKSSICSRLGYVNQADYQNADNHPFSFGPLSALPKQIREYIVARRPDSNSVPQSSLQCAINSIVDIVVAEIVEKIKEKNEGMIAIPNVSLDITEKSSWKPQGKLEAESGTFSDLTSLTRTKDATLSHDGLRFTASCGFGFSQAEINYEKYKLKYGFTVTGRITATVDGLSLATSIVVDFSRTPCRIILKELQMDKLGRVKIKITGLGPFNALVSKFATWITRKWQEEIIVTVENKMRDVIQEHLSMFSCENLRP